MRASKCQTMKYWAITWFPSLRFQRDTHAAAICPVFFIAKFETWWSLSNSARITRLSTCSTLTCATWGRNHAYRKSFICNKTNVSMQMSSCFRRSLYGHEMQAHQMLWSANVKCLHLLTCFSLEALLADIHSLQLTAKCDASWLSSDSQSEIYIATLHPNDLDSAKHRHRMWKRHKHIKPVYPTVNKIYQAVNSEEQSWKFPPTFVEKGAT